MGGHHKDQGERQRGEAEGERNHGPGGISGAAVKQSVGKIEGLISYSSLGESESSEVGRQTAPGGPLQH